MNSQNGWPVLEGDSALKRKWLVPGTARHFYLRDGSAGFLLVFLISWYHQYIEKIDVGIWDDWGWAVRNVRGSMTEVSNHASGTAADVNATRHPLGKANTLYFYVQRARGKVLSTIVLRHFLKHRLKNTIRWGGDYTVRKDEMHFEINVPLVVAERVARKLMNTRRGRRILAANPGAGKVILS